MRSSRRSLGGKRKTKKKDVNVPANGDDLKNDWLKRDVNQVENDIKNGIDGQNLHNHFFKTLTKLYCFWSFHAAAVQQCFQTRGGSGGSQLLYEE